MHQCVKCNTFYKDGAKELLTGCKCGARFFFFIKNEALEKAKQFTVKLSEKEKIQIEHDVYDLIGEKGQDKPIVLDLESIRILKPGQYEISLVDLFRGKPLVYRLEEGKYIIDLASTFKVK
ncbi:MAG: Zn-ribbon domain-containing protein [Nanoarchaeota archaeon]|nr:Zn-ribbon domain-containing protein [Nanoarchaeota archaeon]